jgi:hypothetical protein
MGAKQTWVAGNGLAALGNQNVEPDILVCIVVWQLSTLSARSVLATTMAAGPKTAKTW